MGRIRAPVNDDDPTEGVESSQIVRALEAEFEVLERRDYGGNLLWILYPNLRRPSQGADPAEFEEAVSFLLDVEDVLLAHPRLTRTTSHFTVILAQPRADSR